VSPNNSPHKVPIQFQLFCRHELHIRLPSSITKLNDSNSYTENDVLKGDLIRKSIRDILPDGIALHIPAYSVIEVEEYGTPCKLAVFLIVYGGERIPMTRANGDKYREMTETALSNIFTLRSNRVGRPVSKPFPFPLLNSFLRDYKQQGMNLNPIG